MKNPLCPTGMTFDGIQAPDWVDARVLAAGVAERHTVPTGATIVVPSSDATFYIRWHDSLNAAVPAADVTDGSAGEMKPSGRALRGLTSFFLIAPAACIVTLSFFG